MMGCPSLKLYYMAKGRVYHSHGCITLCKTLPWQSGSRDSSCWLDEVSRHVEEATFQGTAEGTWGWPPATSQQSQALSHSTSSKWILPTTWINNKKKLILLPLSSFQMKMQPGWHMIIASGDPAQRVQQDHARTLDSQTLCDNICMLF